MRALDTDVLIQAHRAESPQHTEALATVEGLRYGTEAWGVPLFAVTEFLKLVTHPKAFNPPSSSDEALNFVHTLLATPTCELLVPGEAFEAHLAEVPEGRTFEGEAYEARIAALCREHNVTELVSNDPDLPKLAELPIATLA